MVAACGRSGGTTIDDADRKKLDAAIAASEAQQQSQLTFRAGGRGGANR